MLDAFALAAGAVLATTVNTVIRVNQILCGINHTTSKRNVILLRQSRNKEGEGLQPFDDNDTVNVNTISFILIVRYNSTVKS